MTYVLQRDLRSSFCYSDDEAHTVPVSISIVPCNDTRLSFSHDRISFSSDQFSFFTDDIVD
ncbi:hypothetical protein L484_002374 [Morus notabilis]|uniref:Uncharacterized protein n=1 Tax=Morus notabilis TaxID=981085 RepID=W9RXV7_9ROSA|nr:hypothetical protein L484_002374 [Morus notabilis]